MSLTPSDNEVTGVYALGITSSIFSGERLNGSFGSESKCDLIVALSTTTRDDGKVTGSLMTVYKSESRVHPKSVRQETMGRTLK